ncbi:MAG: amidohydrolase family protein [Planctomycetota bacterium]
MIVDCHVPVYDEAEYAPMLAETAQNLGIDKLCLMSGRQRYRCVGNDQVLEYSHKYPDMFIPIAHLDLAEARPENVQKLVLDGFCGIRVDVPPAPYDDAQFYGVYEAAATVGVPLFFHTGFVPRSTLDKAINPRMRHMRPSCLDTIARRFPGLDLVGCGLGGPWYEEAAETLRWNENVYFDLSGCSIRNRGAAFFRSVFGPFSGPFSGKNYRGGLWERIMFGTGAHYKHLAAVESGYRRLLHSLAVSDDVVSDIMAGNALKLLNCSG